MPSPKDKTPKDPEAGLYHVGPGGPVPPPLPAAKEVGREPTAKRLLASVPPEVASSPAGQVLIFQDRRIDNIEAALGQLKRESEPPFKKAQKWVEVGKWIVAVVTTISGATWAVALYTSKLATRDDLTAATQAHEVVHQSSIQPTKQALAEMENLRVIVIRAELRAAQAEDRAELARLESLPLRERNKPEHVRNRARLTERMQRRGDLLSDPRRLRRLADDARTDPSVTEDR